MTTRVARRVALGVALALAAAGCPQRRARDTVPLADPVLGSDGDAVAAMIAELQDEVLTAYERDEPPALDIGMIDPAIGGARIGVGPGDVLVARDIERAPSRWPLRIDRDMPTEVRSKRLAMHLAQDLSAAWVVDELSWRIGMCGRTAVIPLRMTMLFARDGDRWAPVYEHLSFGAAPAPRPGGALFGATVPPAVASRDLADELSSVLNPVLAQGGRGARPGTLATGPEALLLGPAIDAEWHGADVLVARLVPGALRADDRRVGYVGRTPARATIAYWIGNVIADIGGQKLRLRATFVFEKRRQIDAAEAAKARRGRPEARTCATADADDEACRWVLVQGHVSQPIEDQELATRVFGTALLPTPLEAGAALALTCDDGSPASRAAAPAR